MFDDHPLTPRELDVLALHRAYGLTPVEIAKILGISPSTVRTYQKRILAKLEGEAA